MGDAPEQQDVQQEEKPKSKLPFIIGGFVILLIGIGAVSYTLLIGSSGDDSVTPTQTPAPLGYMYSFSEPFVVNLAPPDDQYLLNANITLEIIPVRDAKEAAALEELGLSTTDNNKNKMPIVKQVISEILSSQTRVQVTSMAGRERIRYQIITDLNDKLKTAQIKEVYMQVLVP
jgi:flagellar protein FliL